MAMKFAFSTACCPDWDLSTLAAKAREFGYNGVAIDQAASAALLADPGKTKEVLGAAGVGVACVAVAMSGTRRTDAQAAEVRRLIDAVQQLGCRHVQVPDVEVARGNYASAAGELAEWLTPLADYAAERDVMIVLANTFSFRTARQIWMVLEMIDHPSIAAALDVLIAMAAGEAPAVSVPVLNTRIQLVRVADAKVSAAGVAPCKLGDGSVPLPDLFRRLRGIGYNGWVTYQPAKGAAAGEMQQELPAALAKLRQWTQPPAPVEKKPAAAHAAAKAPPAGASKPPAAPAAAKEPGKSV